MGASNSQTQHPPAAQEPENVQETPDAVQPTPPTAEARPVRSHRPPRRFVDEFAPYIMKRKVRHNKKKRSCI